MSTGADTVERATDSSQTGPAHAVALSSTAATSVILAGGLVLTGFNPLNTASDRLHVTAHPLLVLLTPGVLLSLLAVVAAWAGGSRRFALPAVHRIAWVSGALLLGAGALSIINSMRPGYSAALVVSGLLAPLAIFAVVSSGRYRPELLAGAFLVVVTVVLLRADVVYLRLSGFPTSQSILFSTKFVSIPYDFHYYTLGNPDSTAGFLLLPLGLALFWAAASETRTSTRLWLAVPITVIVFTLVLLYARFAGLVALAMVVAAFLCSPLPRRIRAAIGGVVLAAVAGFGALSPGHYLLDLFSSGSNSSGQTRINSLRGGWHALIHHPLTGVGLGGYGGANGQIPAHSSIIQGGAEMGILGAAAIALVTGAVIVGAARHVRRHGATGIRGAAWIAAACYVFVCALSGVAAEGVMIEFVSVYGLSLALVMGIAVAVPGSASRTSHPLGRRTPTAARPRRWVLAGWWHRLRGGLQAAIVVSAIALVSAASTLVTHTAVDYQLSSEAYLNHASTASAWSFSSVPTTWQQAVAGIAPAARKHGVVITTTSRPGNYQLISPLLVLPAGNYQIVAHAQVNSGYLVLGALDVNANRWVNTRTFGPLGRHERSHPLTVGFTLSRASGLRIALANASLPVSSRWLLHTVSFTRSPAPSVKGSG